MSSRIYFPLRSNAAGLLAGAGVAAVRRRILAASLLHDQVILEDGLFVSWSGQGGGLHVIERGDLSGAEWQSPKRRGAATGAIHYVAMKPTGAPEAQPGHAVVSTPADFSWQATFEPFRRELPASAADWLAFGHPTDDSQIKDIVAGWEREDRWAPVSYRNAKPQPTGFSASAVLSAGYYDLATSAAGRVGISIDKRHAGALTARLALGGAERIRGGQALEILLPTGFSWEDVPALRRARVLREYRAILGEIEDAAFDAATSVEDLRRRIESDYRSALAKAEARGVPFAGRVALTVVGFALGAAADLAAPIAGGAAASAATFAAAEVLSAAAKPRWLAVDRQLRRVANRRG